MSKYYLVPLTGYYAGQYAVVGDIHYAIATLPYGAARALKERLEREDANGKHY